MRKSGKSTHVLLLGVWEVVATRGGHMQLPLGMHKVKNLLPDSLTRFIYSYLSLLVGIIPTNPSTIDINVLLGIMICMEFGKDIKMNKTITQKYKAVIKGLHKNIVDLSTTKEKLARMFAKDSKAFKAGGINFGARFENWNPQTKELFDSWIPKDSDKVKLAYQIQTSFTGSKMLFADGSFNVALATKKKSSLKNLQNLGIAKIAADSVYKPTEKPKPTATKGKGKTAKVVKRTMEELTTDVINGLTEMIQHEESI